MKLAIYSTKQYDRKYLELVNQQFGYELEFFDFLLSKKPPKRPPVARQCASSLTTTAAVKCSKNWRRWASKFSPCAVPVLITSI